MSPRMPALLVAAVLGTGATPHAHAAPEPSPPASAPEPTERRDIVVGASINIDFDRHTYSDLRLGWMVHPRVAVFATRLASAYTTSSESGERYHMLGVGSRFWFIEPAFLDVRIGYGEGVVSDWTATMSRRTVGWMAAFGVELRYHRVGLEFTVGNARIGDANGAIIALGATLY